MVYHLFDVEHEPENVTYVNTFNWQGDQFEKRPKQSKEIVYSRRKRETNDGHASQQSWSNRRDQIDSGVLVVVEKISTIDKYLIGPPRSPFHFPRQMFVILIMETNEIGFEEIAVQVLTKLWLDYGIANVILITPCADGAEVLILLIRIFSL